MIAYIEGKLLNKTEDRIIVLAGPVGYEVLVPGFVMDKLHGAAVGEVISLFIYQHQTERQPNPVLIGFKEELEKQFFLLFISVEAIGPLKAVKALSMPIGEIARAIEERDSVRLKGLKGIGARTAQKIIASLEGKVGKFTYLGEKPDIAAAVFKDKVLEVLVTQLGHKPAEAGRMVAEALARNSSITTPEELFDEVYRDRGIQ